MHTARRLLALLSLLGSELVAVAVLVRLGRRDPFVIPVGDLNSWARTTDPADAIAAILRLVALGAAAWLLLTTVLFLVARATDVPRALRTLEWLTLPIVRRVVDRAVVLVAVGAFVSPAGATDVSVRDGRSDGTSSPPTTTTRVPSAAAAPVRAVPAAVAPSAASPATTVVVAPGDNLWALAATHLAATTGRARSGLDNAEIATYWTAVCDVNRSRVRSGDVNLVYPGEVIVLPARA